MNTPGPNTVGCHSFRCRRVFIALVLFGVSFGYVEAAIVVYLRALYEPMQHRLHPESDPGELFPLLRYDDLQNEGPEHVRRLVTEMTREIATLVMLAGVGLAVAHNVYQWIAAVMISFGLWDVFFYVFLKLLVDWPASLFTWDILFLLPVPWVGPVAAPALVAVSMIMAGSIILWRESTDWPVRLGKLHWLTVIGGGALIVVAFCWDWRNIVAGGRPNPFNWPLLLFGEALGVAALCHAMVAGGKACPSAASTESG